MKEYSITIVGNPSASRSDTIDYFLKFEFYNDNVMTETKWVYVKELNDMGPIFQREYAALEDRGYVLSSL